MIGRKVIWFIIAVCILWVLGPAVTPADASEQADRLFETRLGPVPESLVGVGDGSSQADSEPGEQFSGWKNVLNPWAIPLVAALAGILLVFVSGAKLRSLAAVGLGWLLSFRTSGKETVPGAELCTTTYVGTPASQAGLTGAGLGSVVTHEGRTLVRMAGQDFYISGVPSKGMWVPKGGSSSVLFIFKRDNPNKMFRLDYGYNKATGQTEWHVNQKGVANILGLREVNHTGGVKPAVYGRAMKVFKWGGRALFVAAAVGDIIEIYRAEDKARTVTVTAGRWAGGGAGAWAGAKAGAAVGAWFGPWGAAAGAVIGGLSGGIAGAYAGETVTEVVYDRVFTKLEEEEWIALTPEEAAAATGMTEEELLGEGGTP